MSATPAPIGTTPPAVPPPAAAAAPTPPAAPPAAAVPVTPPASPPGAPTAPTAADAKPSEPAAAAAAAPPAETPRQVAEKLKLLRDRQALEADRTTHAEDIRLAKDVRAARDTKDPVKALAALGYKPDEIAAFLVNGAGAPAKPAEPKAPTLEEQLAETRKTVDELKTGAQKQAQEQRTAQEQEARAEALQIVADAKETLPFVNALGQGDAVIAEWQSMHKKAAPGVEVSFEEAAKAVEARFAAQMPAQFDRLVAVPAVRAALEAALAKMKPVPPAVPPAAPGAPVVVPPAAEEKKPELPPDPNPMGRWKTQRRTLSNDIHAPPAAPPAKPKTEVEVWRQQVDKFKALP